MAIIGPPNAGKSTLINAAVDEKVSIASPKMQTTRARVLGVAIHKDTQVEYVDTPGMLSPLARFGGKKVMRDLLLEAADATMDADAIVCVLDAAKTWGPNETHVLRSLESSHALPVHFVLNKIDYLPGDSSGAQREDHKWRSALWDALGDTDGVDKDRVHPGLEDAPISMVSAKYGEGLDSVFSWVADILPEGSWNYPSWWKSDASPVDRIQDLIKEQVFIRLNQEIPYIVHPTVTHWTPLPSSAKLRIDVELPVKTLVQARALIGKHGSVISAIKSYALPGIAEAVGKDESDVLLYLRVVRV